MCHLMFAATGVSRRGWLARHKLAAFRLTGDKLSCGDSHHSPVLAIRLDSIAAMSSAPPRRRIVGASPNYRPQRDAASLYIDGRDVMMGASALKPSSISPRRRDGDVSLLSRTHRHFESRLLACWSARRLRRFSLIASSEAVDSAGVFYYTMLTPILWRPRRPTIAIQTR